MPLQSREARIAASTLAALGAHVVLRSTLPAGSAIPLVPLVAMLLVGGVPLVLSLIRSIAAGQLNADFLAGISIVTSVILGEYVVAAVVILMLSGGQALERYATRRAASILEALAKRTPSVAHRMQDDTLIDVPLADVSIGDALAILPHETCPADGIVRAGIGTMDESYLSGEPYLIRKTVGSTVLSGAINGDSSLTIVVTRRPEDSRYASIVSIVKAAETKRPRMRRIADRLGGWYTPIAVSVAAVAWLLSGDSSRFLSVLVIATPCPLLLALPVAIIGAISVAGARGILIKDAAILETLSACRTAIFDKTGTLTLGRPAVTDVVLSASLDRLEVLSLAASLEQYSKHPLAAAVVAAADRAGAPRREVSEVSEPSGAGLSGLVDGRAVRIIGRGHLAAEGIAEPEPVASGLECMMLVDGVLAATFRFRDELRPESAAFVNHLRPRHGFSRLLLVSGDRESEVRSLATSMKIELLHFSQSPEQKLAIVTEERRLQPVLFVGDGLNDAPAMVAATAAVALGSNHDVTAASAGAVIMDGSLSRVDELLHIARRARRIALQSAVGGMLLSGVGVGLAAAGWLPALSGAVAQEVIDLAAVLSALRASFPPRALRDFDA
jgi:heavy metal translocating P-type ATPase